MTDRSDRVGHQPRLTAVSTRYEGGISTVSIMYTVAFAVGTPPQTTLALLTLRPLP